MVVGEPEARLLVCLCRSRAAVKIISVFEKERLKSSHPPDLNGHMEARSEPAATTAVLLLANLFLLKEKKLCQLSLSIFGTALCP